MIDVEAVAWTLLIAHPRHGAIEGIAKPVDDQAQVHQVQRRRPLARPHVSAGRRQHRHRGKPCQMIRMNGLR
jgi:hypothetical protein